MKSALVLLFCSVALSINGQPVSNAQASPNFRQLERERILLQNEQESIKENQESGRLQLEEDQARVTQMQQYEIWLEQQLKQHDSQSNGVPSALKKELTQYQQDQADVAQKVQLEQEQLKQETLDRFGIEQELAKLKEERLRIKSGEQRPLLEQQQSQIKQELAQAQATYQQELDRIKQRQQEILKVEDKQYHLQKHWNIFLLFD